MAFVQPASPNVLNIEGTEMLSSNTSSLDFSAFNEPAPFVLNILGAPNTGFDFIQVITNPSPPSGQTVTGIGSFVQLAQSAFVFDAGFQVKYFSNLNIGDSIINITNTGANGAGLGFGTSASVAGAICANVYAYDPSEEIVSCCSCPVTPNGLVSLSAKNDIINNPLTRGNPTSIVIELFATVPVGGTCNNSALLAGTVTPANGLAAWGTTLHANLSAAAGTYAVTETAFTPSTLSPGEQARLAYGCGVVANVGSGFGVCNSCRLGGLGAQGR